MEQEYLDVDIKIFNDSILSYEDLLEKGRLKLKAIDGHPNLSIIIFRNNEIFKQVTISSNNWDCSRIGDLSLTLFSPNFGSYLFTFPSHLDVMTFKKQLLDLSHSMKNNESKKDKHEPLDSTQNRENNGVSLFDKRTDQWSAVQYFQFYSFLSQQQNMMQDFIRTSTYQRAVLSNLPDFRNKVVMDMGAGSGILSFFAVQGGAKRVYAVEASSMAEHCELLVRSNKLSGKIIVLNGKIEEIKVPEPIDIIISEPMGYMLFNERMLESYVHSRKFLKRDGGKMFPTVAHLYAAPFSDEALYVEQISKSNFWFQTSFHGVNLSSLHEAAEEEYLKQPVVDTFDVSICVSNPICHKVDFMTANEADLDEIDIPVKFVINTSGCIHGFAFWFDVGFLGSQNEVWLSTAPTEPLTHWYQVRCLFQKPIFALEHQVATGRVLMVSNTRQSYDVHIELSLDGSDVKASNCLDLKNPYFRYTGMPVQPPPGIHYESPTDAYFAKMSGQPANPSVPHYSFGAGNNGGSSVPLNDSANQSLNISSQYMIGDYAANMPAVVNHGSPASINQPPNMKQDGLNRQQKNSLLINNDVYHQQSN